MQLKTKIVLSREHAYIQTVALRLRAVVLSEGLKGIASMPKRSTLITTLIEIIFNILNLI